MADVVDVVNAMNTRVFSVTVLSCSQSYHPLATVRSQGRAVTCDTFSIDVKLGLLVKVDNLGMATTFEVRTHPCRPLLMSTDQLTLGVW